MGRSYYRKRSSSRKTRKNVPWKGWAKIEPKGRERTKMYRDCGKKCFLGKVKEF